MLKYFSLAVLLFSLISCSQDVRTFIDYSIQNNSSTVITVYGADKIHLKELNQNINPGEKVMLTEWTRMGRSVQIFEPEIIFSDTLYILNGNGDTLKKDFWHSAFWEQNLNATRETATHNYVFEIGDKDFLR